MWYILYMNKDVIYIEPDDDITDIITKIENSKSKIVALVPPKKAGVFRSVVNIKLIAKTGTSASKNVVLVTADPSISKLAAATKLPVAKNLQSAPSIPTIESDIETVSRETLNNDDEYDDSENEESEELEPGSDEEGAETKDDETEDNTENDTDEEDENGEEKDDDKEDEEEEKPVAKKKSNKKNHSAIKSGLVGWFTSNKKRSIALAVCGVALIGVLVWAFVIAPAVTITVGIKTTANNFSEPITFTTNLSEENADIGKFYLEEKKVEAKEEVEFEATGKKNVGEKAHGEVMVLAKLSYRGGTKVVQAGDTFTNNGLTYIANRSVTMSYDGDDDSVCANIDSSTTREEFKTKGCHIYAKIEVTAEAPGAKYNIAATDVGWNTTADVSVYTDKPMTGGSDEEILIVQQSDIDNAKSQLAGANLEESKAKLLEQLGENAMIIDSSMKQSTSDAESTPKVGEEVKDGVKPTLKAVTVTSVFVIDKTKVEEFITKKANVSDSQKIYEIKNPFIENFAQTSDGYTGKLKTSYNTGPKITENSVVEKSMGKGLGEVQHDLKDIDGVASVTIDKSFPWVTSVPGNPNKATVILEVKDQDGNTINQKNDDKKEDDDKQESSDKTEE